MLITLEQVLILFLFIVTGFLLAKGKIVDPNQVKILSALEVYLFLPCVSFNNFYKNFTPGYLMEKYPLILVSLVLLVIMHLLSMLLAKLFARTEYEKSIFGYTFTIPNYGYTGYALCQGIFGELALLDMMMFTLPMAVYTGSVGYNMLTKRTGGKFRWSKIFTPVVIGILLGCVVGITGLKLPTVITDVTGKAGACMAPVSMLLTGIAISEFDLKGLLTEKRAYLVSAIRLLGIPVLIWGALKLFGLGGMAATAVLVYAMPCGMNTIVYPKLIGEDCRIGASMTLISTVLSLITIPMCLQFLT